ncbi:MAG: hypothetical protein AB1Z23_06540 [Eubacteriales bacterium]
MNNKKRSKAAMFPFPIIVVIIYFIIGYMWDLWNPGWLLFLTIPLYYSAITIMQSAKNDERKRIWKLIPYPIFCVIVYLVLGMFYELWHPAWLIFLTIPLWTFFVSTKGYEEENTDNTSESE